MPKIGVTTSSRTCSADAVAANLQEMVDIALKHAGTKLIDIEFNHSVAPVGFGNMLVTLIAKATIS